MIDKPYSVRAVHCDHRASDEEVYQALKRAAAPLHRSWQRLRRAKTIAIKFNQDKEPDSVVMFAGHRQQLVSDCVARAVLRLLRENTAARLICVDARFYAHYNNADPATTTTLAPILHEFGVEYADCNVEPIVWQDVPGGGLMFRRYPLARPLVEADERVSVQKIKNHGFMGVTLCLKNLFGLMPMEPIGRPRAYYHHFVRMPYMLADIGRTLNPALNIIDALVGQAGTEWGDGKGMARVVDGLVAGDHAIATDAYVTHLMGHDPTSDWPQPPFHRDRNALLVAAQAGFGTVNLNEIDVETELARQPDGVFFANMTDTQEIVRSWRRTMCEQALHYRDHQSEYRSYAGEYILLQRGAVRWHDPSGRIMISRRNLAGAHPDQAMWLKYVDPDEHEGERYNVYEQTLRSAAE
jgi:uncharacterized protein (DUF362 family)